jgi:nucleotide-binding universal stress UspA family protein
MALIAPNPIGRPLEHATAEELTMTIQADQHRYEATALPDDPLVGVGGQILVGFDGSPASESALTWAVARATTRGVRRIVLVGVVDDDSGAMGQDYADLAAEQAARLLSRTADRVSEKHPSLLVDTRLARGSVAVGLAGAGSDEDLVVVGSDKTGYARGRVYGSRSLQLAAVAGGTIAVIPAVDLRLREGVVVALQEPERAGELARMGAREAVQRRSSLSLVHAIPLESGPERHACADLTLAAGRAAASQESPHLEVTSFLAHRRPAEAILNLSRDKALLLVGRSRRPEPNVLGGTLHEVLMNANVPVVVIR